MTEELAGELAAWLREQVEADMATARAAIDNGASLQRGTGTWHVSHSLCDPSCDDGCPDAGRCHAAAADPGGECRCCAVAGDDILIYEEGGHTQAQAVHIARHDPRDVIADCEAKLAILDEYEAQPGFDLEPGVSEGRDDAERLRDEGVKYALENVVRLLAEGCRHREGWRKEWAA
ncbi:MAG TPA: DUF6221 family protein [Streptosporangiaceae bacterium]|nr:DUF6221 family protein [Streptosporangiaceae bacterium]